MKPTLLTDFLALLPVAPIATDAVIHRVSVDSRHVQKGDLFFALPGAQVDGHQFLEEAAKKGAVAAVVHSSYRGPTHSLQLLYVDDVLLTLQQLAKKSVERSAIPIIGVTGSVGKTTTKEFLTTLLRGRKRVFASPGNSNSQIGLPMAILNEASFDEDVFVLEISMSHPGNITKLIEIAPPTIAVVNIVALVHACNFESIAEIAKAKAEIFSRPETKIGIYHLESDYEKMLSEQGVCSKITFSTTNKEADFFLNQRLPELSIQDPSEGVVAIPPLPVLGVHNQHNFLAAVTAARCLGVDWCDIKEQVASLVLPEKRLQVVKKHGALFFNDSYNASELSVKAAIDALPQPNTGRKRIAVLGEMMELGKFSAMCHRSVGIYALDRIDELVCFGEGCLPMAEEWEKQGRRVSWSSDRAGAVAALKQMLQQDDVVLLKGSRSKEVWKVLDEL